MVKDRNTKHQHTDAIQEILLCLKRTDTTNKLVASCFTKHEHIDTTEVESPSELHRQNLYYCQSVVGVHRDQNIVPENVVNPKKEINVVSENAAHKKREIPLEREYKTTLNKTSRKCWKVELI